MNKIHMTGTPFYDLPSPDDKGEAKECSKDLEELLEKLNESFEKDWKDLAKHLKSIDQILEPEKINSFLQATIRFEDNENYREYTGVFISKLIQDSYDVRNNNFVLNTKSLKEIHNIGVRLEGTKEKPIQITIEGNTGDGCGYEAYHLTFNIKGNAGYGCGSGSVHSTFNIEGNTGDNCGQEAQNSTFKIKGNTGDLCGYEAYHLTFKIKGNIGDQCGLCSENTTFEVHGRFGMNTGGSFREGWDERSKNSTFITYKQETYKRLLEELPKTNIAVLEDRNGNVLKKKRRGYFMWRKAK